MLSMEKTNTVNFVSTLQKLASFILERPVDVLASASGSSTDLKKTISVLMAADLTEDEKTKALVRLLHEIGHHEEKTIPFERSNPELLNRMINMVDDIRIEQRQEKKYHGLRELRKWYHPVVYQQFNQQAIATATKADLPEFIHKLSCVLLHTIRFRQLGLDVSIEMSKEIQGAYDMYLRDLETQAEAQDAPKDAVKLGTLIYERIKKLVEDQYKPPKSNPQKSKKSKSPEQKDQEEQQSQDSEDDSKDDSKDDSEDDSKDNSEDNSEDDSKDDSEDDSEGDTEDNSEGDSEGDTKDDSEGDTEDDSEEDAQEQAEKAKQALDDLERNANNMRSLEEQLDCDLQEKHAPGQTYLVDPSVKEDIRYATESHYGQRMLELGKLLLGAAGIQMTKLFVTHTKPRNLYNQDSGRFDARAFLADPLDVRTNVYTAKIRGKLDKAAVSFVMDNSNSMTTDNKCDTCYQVLSGLLYYLSRAAVPTEAVGFTIEEDQSTTNYRQMPMILRIIKTFSDPYDVKAQARCAPPYGAMRNTLEVDALKWAVPRLLARPEPKKILMVLGDGGTGFATDYALNFVAREAYIQYVKDCKALGICVVGFGLECNLSAIFGDDYISVSPYDVGQKMLEKLTKILNKGRG